MISVAGRPRRKWDAKVIVTEGRIMLSLNDTADPEFWVEIMLDDEETERVVVEWCQCLTETVITLGDFEMRQ